MTIVPHLVPGVRPEPAEPVPHRVVGAQPEPDEPEERRVTATVSSADIAVALGALIAGISATALIYYWLAPFSGLLGGLLGEMGPQQADAIRPRALRDVVVRYLAEAAEERDRRKRLPRLGAVAR